MAEKGKGQAYGRRFREDRGELVTRSIMAQKAIVRTLAVTLRLGALEGYEQGRD